MTDKQLARVLIEKLSDANIHKKIAVYVNRLMLRLHSQPALIANLADVSVHKPGSDAGTRDQVEDGEFQESIWHGVSFRQFEKRMNSILNEEATEDRTATAAFDDNTPDNEFAPNKEELDKEDDSLVILQLSFRRLPQEVIAPLVRLIASPRDPKLFKYSKDGSARTGVEIDLKPDDFPGDDFDYAF